MGSVSTPPPQPRILLIGAGVIAHHHAEGARAWQADIPLFAADPNERARAAFAAKFGCAVYPDAASMLAAVPPAARDVVVVATPPNTHAPCARLALENGRHVLCEKPLAMNDAEAAAMCLLAEAQGRLLGCCSSRFRGLPTTAHVRKLVSAGSLGRELHLTWMQRDCAARSGIEYQPGSRWFLDRAVSGGGCLLDWGPYDIACWTEFLEIDRVDVLHAWASKVDRPPHVPENCVHDVESRLVASIRLTLKNGDHVALSYERTSAVFGPEFSHFSLEGENGTVTWDWRGYGPQVVLEHFREENGASETHRIEAANPPPFLHARPVHFMLNRLSGQPSEGGIFGAEALFNFRILTALYTAAETGAPATVTR